MQPDVTDVDYNGSALWITDLKRVSTEQKKRKKKLQKTF